MFEKSAIVVAHPDDECLWFSSILNKVERIIIVFTDWKSNPEVTQGRYKSLREFPLKNVHCFEMTESDCFQKADWWAPKVEEYGMVIGNAGISRKYQENYREMSVRLSDALNGVKTVYTHSPWGEYGHEEHVQVHRAVRSVRKDKGYDLWYPNYLSNKSLHLFNLSMPTFTNRVVSLKTDPGLGETIKSLYEKHHCWTWYRDWQWFESETFHCAPGDERSVEYVGACFPVNMIKVKYTPPHLLKKRKGWRRVLRKLKQMPKKFTVSPK